MMLIDWNRFVLLLLPLRLRVATVFGFIRACLAPVATLHNDLSTYWDGSNGVKYKLKHNYQVWSIEKVLNDEFDPVERRIYTLDTEGYEALFLQRDEDLEPVMLDTDTYSTLLVHRDSNYTGSGFDAIVVLPYHYPASSVYRMRALIDYYRLAGVRYDIIVIE